jgi:hypothetical protein
MKTTTPISQDQALALTLALFHWHIPDPIVAGEYAWDTRAAVVMPGWEGRKRNRVAQVYVRGGPAASIMLEGPDEGLRGGAHLEVGGSVDIGFLPLTASAGWLWLIRRPIPEVGEPGADQHGLLLSVGIGF